MPDGSLSHFKATLARKIERNQKRQSRVERNSLAYKSSDSIPEYQFQKLSEGELEEVKAGIRKKVQKERKIELIMTILIFTSIAAVILILILIFI